jgi:hypothetical protein
MAFQVSPGVVTKEIDLTLIVPAVATTIAGFSGRFEWGPADQIVIVDSENQLVQLYGKPTLTNYVDFFTAANFLGYGRTLKVNRYVKPNATNAGSSGASVGILIKNDDSYTSTGMSCEWGARYPGEKGNSLKVEWHDGGWTGGDNGVSGGQYDLWTHSDEFSIRMPFTSQWIEDLTGSTTCNDGVNILVVDEDGEFSGTKGTVLERFEAVSKASNAKKYNGESNYYKDIINNSSKYIWWGGHPVGGETADGVTAGSVWGTEATVTGITYAHLWSGGTSGDGYSKSLTGGSGSNDPDRDDIPTSGSSQGYAIFADAETVDVNLLIGGANTDDETALPIGLVDICDARKDCVVFLSPDKKDVVANENPRLSSDSLPDVLAFRNTQLNKSSSYAFLDSGWKYMYDRYNDRYIWTPLCADTAGIAVRSDEATETWFSPAGFNRGQVRGVIKLSFNPTLTQRDALYKDQINPVVAFPGEGTVLFGDKTLQSKPSAFDRINVRRLFIVLEKAIATASKFQLFEQNDAFTRAQFKNLVEPFLRDVQSRRGIIDFKVVCDESNNTGEVIDRNEFIADIFIKPTRSINFITLNFIAARTGIDFSEIGGV